MQGCIRVKSTTSPSPQSSPWSSFCHYSEPPAVLFLAMSLSTCYLHERREQGADGEPAGQARVESNEQPVDNAEPRKSGLNNVME